MSVASSLPELRAAPLLPRYLSPAYERQTSDNAISCRSYAGEQYFVGGSPPNVVVPRVHTARHGRGGIAYCFGDRTAIRADSNGIRSRRPAHRRRTRGRTRIRRPRSTRATIEDGIGRTALGRAARTNHPQGPRPLRPRPHAPPNRRPNPRPRTPTTPPARTDPHSPHRARPRAPPATRAHEGDMRLATCRCDLPHISLAG